MKKVILSLMCLAVLAIAEDSTKNTTAPDAAKAGSKVITVEMLDKNKYDEMYELEKQLFKETLEKLVGAARIDVDNTSKMIAAFKKGERLFCNNQIVSAKKGWMIEDNWLLTKDDHFYSINQCFIKK